MQPRAAGARRPSWTPPSRPPTAAQRGWGETPPLARARVLFKFLQLVQERKGCSPKPSCASTARRPPDALGEVARGIENIRFATAMPQLLKGEYTEQVARGLDAWSLRQPLGVVAGITPFNFPAMVPLWMFPLAIGCGNAPEAQRARPSASLLLAQWLQDAGLPDGVFNVVQGDKDLVDAILAHPASRPSASWARRRWLNNLPSGHCARQARQALGGAKNHLIVMPDADLDGAVDALLGRGMARRANAA